MNIVVSTAALAASPSIAIADEPDLDLKAAGERFGMLFAEYLPASFQWSKLARRAKAEAVAEFGCDYSSPAWSNPSPGVSPAILFHSEALRRNGTDRASEQMGNLHEKMEPLAEVIRNAEALSLVGLRSKALVAMWGALPFCATHSGELNFDCEADFRSLLAGTVTVTGLSDLFGSFLEQVRADASEEPEYDETEVADSSQSDPIFAAIERHKVAYERHVATLGEDELEAAIPASRRKSNFHDARFGDDEWRVATDDPRWIAHIEESCAAGEAETEAAIALVSTENLTRSGALSLLRYAMELEAKDSKCWPDDLVDDNDKRRSYQYFLMERVVGALEFSGVS